MQCMGIHNNVQCALVESAYNQTLIFITKTRKHSWSTNHHRGEKIPGSGRKLYFIGTRQLLYLQQTENMNT